MNHIEAINRLLFLQINGNIDTPAWLIQVGVIIANDLIYLVPLLLICMWLWGDSSRRNQAIKACLAVFLALSMSYVISLIWPHPRPFMIGLGHAWTHHAPDPSFPSDHVTILVSIGLAWLSSGAFRLAAVILILSLAVAWARVFVGVHFPLDMLGSIVVASIACAIILPRWKISGEIVTNYIERLYRNIFARPIASRWIRY